MEYFGVYSTLELAQRTTSEYSATGERSSNPLADSRMVRWYWLEEVVPAYRQTVFEGGNPCAVKLLSGVGQVACHTQILWQTRPSRWFGLHTPITLRTRAMCVR